MPCPDLTLQSFKDTLKQTPYDILLCGFPCQPFSIAGERRGFDDLRGTIFFHLAEIIQQTRPMAVFLENVPGLLNHDGGRTVKKILETLSDDLNYHVVGARKTKRGYSIESGAAVRCAHEFGLPQNRARIFLVAFDKSLFGSAVCALPSTLPAGGMIPDTVLSILDDNVSDRYTCSENTIRILTSCSTRSTKIIRHGVLARTLCACNWGKYNNLVPLDCGGYRVLTPGEYARLQGFDFGGRSDFSFPQNTSDSVKYKTLGNSVAVPVVEALARFTINCLDQLLDGSTDQSIPGASVQLSLGAFQ